MDAAARERLSGMVDGLWDFRDAAASEGRFLEAAAGEEGLVRLGLLTQAARAQGLQRRFDEATATLDGVERELGESAGHAGDDAGVVGVMLLLERGRVKNSSGDRAAAMVFFERAWEAARGVDDALAVDAAHMAAIAGAGEAAVRWNETALEAAEASADPRARRWRASLLNNLGWTYHERGEYGRALELFERALEARRERGQERETLIARWAVARCLRSLGRVEEALGEQRSLEAAWEKIGEPDGYVFEEIGECLLLLGRDEEARGPFARAHAILSEDPWMVEHEGARLERLAELGG